MTAERLTDAEFLARLDRDTEVSLRDHPERWRWVRAGGVKSSAPGLRARSNFVQV